MLAFFILFRSRVCLMFDVLEVYFVKLLPFLANVAFNLKHRSKIIIMAEFIL